MRGGWKDGSTPDKATKEKEKENTKMNTRSLIRSQWDRITFYGRPMEEGASALPSADEPPMPKVFDDEPEMILEGREFGGWGKLTPDGFLIFAGSFANEPTPSFRKDKVYFPIRQRLEADGVIQDGLFVSDYLFKSAAQAGCVIAAACIQATKKWHTIPDEDGATLTYAECHPKMKEGKAKATATARRKPEPPPRNEDLDAVVFRSKALIDGKAWTIEYRGHVPFHPNGVYLGEPCECAAV